MRLVKGRVLNIPVPLLMKRRISTLWVNFSCIRSFFPFAVWSRYRFQEETSKSPSSTWRFSRRKPARAALPKRPPKNTAREEKNKVAEMTAKAEAFRIVSPPSSSAGPRFAQRARCRVLASPTATKKGARILAQLAIKLVDQSLSTTSCCLFQRQAVGFGSTPIDGVLFLVLSIAGSTLENSPPCFSVVPSVLFR